jgi:hypothetical protein
MTKLHEGKLSGGFYQFIKILSANSTPSFCYYLQIIKLYYLEKRKFNIAGGQTVLSYPRKRQKRIIFDPSDRGNHRLVLLRFISKAIII